MAHDQPAHNGDAERPLQFRSRAGSQRQRQPSQQRRHGRHHDGTEAQNAGFINRLYRFLALIPFHVERDVDHHDGVLLHESDEQNDPDGTDHVQFVVRQQQRQQRPHARRGQSRQNGDGMDKALVQHSEHDINRDQGRKDQDRFAG